MPKFIVHQHHHYGWTMNVHEADTEEEAIIADILKYHDWLPQYGHKIVVGGADEEYRRYQVLFNGPPFPGAFYGPWSEDGGHWFGERIHIGKADDCSECGGTGVNHYNPFRQCWSCGDGEDAKGQGTGKVPRPFMINGEPIEPFSDKQIFDFKAGDVISTPRGEDVTIAKDGTYCLFWRGTYKKEREAA